MAEDKLKKVLGNLKKKKEKPATEVEPTEEDLVGAEETEPTGETEQSQEEKIKEAQELIDQEVAVLQNDGVFRRELIGVLNEVVDVQKTNVRVMLGIKKLLEGAE